MASIITLTTDFGLRDGYAAVMKGVLLSLCPESTIVDITHEIPPQDVHSAAYILSTVASRFPRGTIHLGVVDPGVGSNRRGMALLSNNQIFIGPDNGLFSFAVPKMQAAYEILLDPGVSSTFHGRDLFAPAAARLAGGMKPSFLGPPLKNPVTLPAWTKVIIGNRVEGRVAHIDRFGDVITNLSPGDFGGELPNTLAIEGRNLPENIPICRTFSEIPVGQPLWYIGSESVYELAVRDGNASTSFGIRRGDKVFGIK
jgi:S-adenosyl-L-methionine hydrolase (adenosine-forming)